MFPDTRLGTDGWGSAEEFLSAIHSGLGDRRLVSQLSSETSGSDGGFMVPEQFSAQWLDKSLENEIVRPRAKIEPMESASKKIAGFSNSDNSGSAPFGGFAGEWLAEMGEATDVSPTVRAIELVAKKLGIFTKSSNELIEDGVSFEELLGEAMVAAIGWHMDVAFFTGTGAGQPLGVLNDPAKIEVDKEAGQASDTVVYENLTTMFSRMHPACVNNSAWVAHQSCIPQLTNLSVTIGTGGSHIPAMTESDGTFRILTRPILFTEKLPALGDAGDIILADFSQYSIGMRRGVTLEKSNAVNWQTDETNYRSIIRVDGQGRWAQAFTPLNGSTLSWCVTLAERT